MSHLLQVLYHGEYDESGTPLSGCFSMAKMHLLPQHRESSHRLCCAYCPDTFTTDLGLNRVRTSAVIFRGGNGN